MPTLKIQHYGERVVSSLDGQLEEERAFTFELTEQDPEDIRWYLEAYRGYTFDPMPKHAKRIEERLRELGTQLFTNVLGGSEMWHEVKGRLGETRIEILIKAEDVQIPWELMRDPKTNLVLSLQVPSFVRTHPQTAMQPIKPAPAHGKVRILLAICRPKGDDDVPFRSVARHLIRGLTTEAREPFQLDLLRPPTFEQLTKCLRTAHAQGEPYHAVHFDGHGTAGAVLFENPRMDGNAHRVKADDLGKLLHETGVSVLILNACRSAHAEPAPEPERAVEGDAQHDQIRAFGSLAHAVMDCGLAGVVAWRYNVFVDTAAQYMADLYGSLASGIPLGQAATLARKQLHSTAKRTIEDWTVPVVFEASSVQLFSKWREALRIQLDAKANADSNLPQAPDAGFIGRDETILRLDRMFDHQSIVLLHGYAGSGKTSTAVEYTKWRSETGLGAPVLFTSFEHHKTLFQALSQERFFERRVDGWLTLDESDRRFAALELMEQIPVFWIWDNVEPVTGFPAGTQSQWSAAEQKELADFLRAARGTQAKFLLTSRRDERDWLRELPGRVELPPMPFDERVQMAQALAAEQEWSPQDLEHWGPLLRFTQGNPLTLRVLARQALRDGLKKKGQIDGFIKKLQAGEQVFEDEASEGRTRSLSVSLAYGFENAFTEAEQKQLALLHLFQVVVLVPVLRRMAEITREQGIALLDRAAEVGLLTGMGGGYYSIHPALPWFFRQLFEKYYADSRVAAERSFVEAMGELGNCYHSEYAGGNQAVIGPLTLEEPNLLQARNVARANGWWDPVTSAMQGLRSLYDQTGRLAEWSRLVQEIVPDFVDPANDGPLPGREDEWSLVTGYRVSLAFESRNLHEAERLQALRVARARERAAIDDNNATRSLAVSLEHLANIQRELGSFECVRLYEEAFALAQKIGDTAEAAICSFNLGTAYKDLETIRDLALAEEWYRRDLELEAQEDRLGRAKALGQLGSVAYARSHLKKAAEYYEQALEMLPGTAVRELGSVHNQLGLIYKNAGQLDTGLHYYRESIRYKEAMQDRYEAGRTRYNVAVALYQAERFTEARDWAEAALRDFQASPNAYPEIAKTQELLEHIEADLGNQP